MTLPPLVLAAALAVSGPALAAGRRDDESARELFRAMRAFLDGRKLESLGESDARAFLGYRILEGRIGVRALEAHLSRNEGTRVVLRGHEAQALEAMREVADSQRELVGEVALFSKRFTRQVRGISFLDDALPLPPEDQRRARDAGFGTPALNRSFKLQLAEFLLLGACEDGDPGAVAVAPALSDLDPRTADEGFALLDEVFIEADAQVESQPHLEYAAIHALSDQAEALLRKGRTDEAVARWQKILDTYPSSTQFGRIERRMQEERARAPAFAAAVKACDGWRIAQGLGAAFSKRVLTTGADGVRLTVGDIELGCEKDPGLNGRWESVYVSAGLYAASIEDCETVRLMFDRFVGAGGGEMARHAYWARYVLGCGSP